MKKNRLIALGAAVVLSATAVVGGTLAYFTDTDNAKNTFTVGNVKVAVEEKDENGNEWKPEDKVFVPNTSIVKSVIVRNTGDSDAFVWAEIWVPNKLDSSLRLDANEDARYTPMIDEEIAVRLEENPALKDYKGYKFYNRTAPLNKNEITGELLHDVYMSADVKQCTNAEHSDCYVLADGETHFVVTEEGFDIIVYGVGIQADGFNEDLSTAMNAYYGIE